MNKECGCENCTCENKSLPEWLKDQIVDLKDYIPKDAVIKTPVERIPPKILIHQGNFANEHSSGVILKRWPVLTLLNIYEKIENKYCSFTLSGKKRTGILIKGNNKSVFVQPVKFTKGYKRVREFLDGEIINRHIKKHNVIEFDYGIRPIN